MRLCADLVCDLEQSGAGAAVHGAVRPVRPRRRALAAVADAGQRAAAVVGVVACRLGRRHRGLRAVDQPAAALPANPRGALQSGGASGGPHRRLAAAGRGRGALAVGRHCAGGGGAGLWCWGPDYKPKWPVALVEYALAAIQPANNDNTAYSNRRRAKRARSLRRVPGAPRASPARSRRTE